MIDIFDDASDALDFFTSIFNHAPKKQRPVKRQKQPNWVTNDILQARKMRDKYKKSSNTQQYKIWRNKVKSLIKKSKTQVCSNCISTSTNPKHLWHTLNYITGKRAETVTNFIDNKDGNNILDPETVANTFNEYFTSVHKSVRTETPIRSDGNIDIGNIRRHYSQNLKDASEFCIAEVAESFILKQLQNLQVNKATGLGGISAKFLKMSAPIICKPLTHVLNLSIKSNSYPDMLKRAKVSPSFKRGRKADINNYPASKKYRTHIGPKWVFIWVLHGQPIRDS